MHLASIAVDGDVIERPLRDGQRLVIERLKHNAQFALCVLLATLSKPIAPLANLCEAYWR